MKDKIYDLNGEKVMLDSDLASFYDIETKRLNEKVSRNKNLFNERSTWVISKSEKEELWSQNATANISKKSRVNPRVFTKEGVMIISNLIKSDRLKSISYDELISLFDKNDVIRISPLNIRNLIYEIRGRRVMLDIDLANLYECKNGTKSINLAVKINIERFPERYMFQLSEEEFLNLRFQIETSSYEKYIHGGRRYLPYAFTEQGVAMLATVLKTDVALETSINIMDAFVEMKKYISTSLVEQKLINDIVLEDNRRLNNIEEIINNYKDKTNYIFFQGDKYDAYSFLLDIFG